MNSNQMYDETIKRHNREPFHFEKRQDCSQRVKAENFICGDQFELCVGLEQDSIESIYFHGLGCAVSKASASVLCEIMEGKTKAEARKIADQFLRLLKNNIEADEKLFSVDFPSFATVQQVPARYDCAALVWEEFLKFLDQQNG